MASHLLIIPCGLDVFWFYLLVLYDGVAFGRTVAIAVEGQNGF